MKWFVIAMLILTGVTGLLLVRWYLAHDPAHEMPSLPLAGHVGEITVAIPVDGVGSVAYRLNGARFTRPARTSRGLALAAGDEVLIVGFSDSTLVVEPLKGEHS